jgi:hypothetical protein
MSTSQMKATKIGKSLNDTKMKKKITLFIVTIVLSFLEVYAQPLQNTTWKAYEPNGIFFNFFHFGADTLSVGSYGNVATFQVSGNNISLVDLPISGGCPLTDTGRYTYLIHNDTLKFTLVNDQCSSRVSTMTTFYFIRFITSVHNINVFDAIKVYPNPASDEIFVKSNSNIRGSTYFFTNQLGRQILIGKLINEITLIDIQQLPKGIYFFNIAGGKTLNIKVMKK